jgi:hypothetical protein
MSKLIALFAASTLALVAPAGGVQAAIGPDAAACRPGAEAPAVLVRVTGFKARTGALRVQVYGDDPADFLAKGRKLKRSHCRIPAITPSPYATMSTAAGNPAGTTVVAFRAIRAFR